MLTALMIVLGDWGTCSLPSQAGPANRPAQLVTTRFQKEFQIRTSPTRGPHQCPLPEANRLPSGLNWTQKDLIGVIQDQKLVARLSIPDSYRLVAAGGCDPFPIRAETHIVHAADIVGFVEVASDVSGAERSAGLAASLEPSRRESVAVSRSQWYHSARLIAGLARMGDARRVVHPEVRTFLSEVAASCREGLSHSGQSR